MQPCEVYMHMGLLDAVPSRGTHRRRIMDFIYSLRARPDTLGDYTNKDATLRERQVKVVGDFAVTYWFDAPVNIVMVVEVQPADR